MFALEDKMYTLDDVKYLISLEVNDHDLKAWWAKPALFMGDSRTTKEWCSGTPEEIDKFYRKLWGIQTGNDGVE